MCIDDCDGVFWDNVGHWIQSIASECTLCVCVYVCVCVCLCVCVCVCVRALAGTRVYVKLSKFNDSKVNYA